MKMQSLDMIVIVINLVIIGMASKAYQACRENYDKLPDRIPLHFGLSGKADQWAKKSRLSVYWPCAAILAFVIFGSAPWIAIRAHAEAGESLEAGMIGPVISLMTAWLFYNINSGIIAYALGKSASIWPFMKWPLALTLLCGVGVALLPIMMMRMQPAVAQVVICGGVDEKNNPIKPVADFDGTEDAVYALVTWKDLNGSKNLEYDWYAPGNILVHKGRYEFKSKKIKSTQKLWYKIDLNYVRAQNINVFGEWKVEIFADGKKLETADFEIKRKNQ
jgi:hypothetical protein